MWSLKIVIWFVVNDLSFTHSHILQINSSITILLLDFFFVIIFDSFAFGIQFFFLSRIVSTKKKSERQRMNECCVNVMDRCLLSSSSSSSSIELIRMLKIHLYSLFFFLSFRYSLFLVEWMAMFGLRAWIFIYFQMCICEKGCYSIVLNTHFYSMFLLSSMHRSSFSRSICLCVWQKIYKAFSFCKNIKKMNFLPFDSFIHSFIWINDDNASSAHLLSSSFGFMDKKRILNDKKK